MLQPQVTELIKRAQLSHGEGVKQAPEGRASLEQCLTAGKNHQLRFSGKVSLLPTFSILARPVCKVLQSLPPRCPCITDLTAGPGVTGIIPAAKACDPGRMEAPWTCFRAACPPDSSCSPFQPAQASERFCFSFPFKERLSFFFQLPTSSSISYPVIPSFTISIRPHLGLSTHRSHRVLALPPTHLSCLCPPTSSSRPIIWVICAPTSEASCLRSP